MTTTQVSENEHIVALPVNELVDLETAGYPDSAYLRTLNTDHVETLVASDLENIPPIIVTKRRNQWVVVDGYHRLAASKHLKRDTVPAIICSYASDNDVIDAAFQANMQHGLILSRADKEKYVLWLAKAFPKLSQTEIASRSRLTQATVSRMLAKYKKELEDLHNASEIDEEYRSTGGSSYVVPQINHTRTLLVSMATFFENERTHTGDITGTKNEAIRTKALVAMVQPDEEVAEMFDSLARSLNNAATLVRAKLEQKEA